MAWINTPRKQGGLGKMNIPILADKTHDISRRYGVLKEDEGVAFRGLFLIDEKGILRQITSKSDSLFLFLSWPLNAFC